MKNKEIGIKSNKTYTKEAMEMFLSKPDLFPLHHYFCKALDQNLNPNDFFKSLPQELLEKYEEHSDILEPKYKNKDISSDFVITSTAILTLKRNFIDIPYETIVVMSRFLWMNLFSERLQRLGCFKRKSNKDWDLSDGYLQRTKSVEIIHKDGSKEINHELTKVTFKEQYYELFLKDNKD